MPKVIMLGKSRPRTPIPVAGQFRDPIGRVLDLQSAERGLSGASVRAGLMAPLLRGAGVGMQQIPSYTIPETIPGAARLPQLRATAIERSFGPPRSFTPRRYNRPMAVPAYVRNERIPGAVRLPQVGFPPSALNGVGFPPSALMGYIPGQNRLPMLRGGGLGGAGLGDIDMCTDPGWVFANNALAAAGAVMQGAAGTDQGWRAAGGATAGAADAWRNTCRAEAQRRQQAANAQGDPTELETLRREFELEQIRREAEGEAYQRYQAAGGTNRGGVTGEIPTWAYAAGAAGIGLLALLILK